MLIYKILIFVPLIIFIISSIIINKEIKICLCTIGKDENRYAIEFIDYYKKHGVDKIFLYDNNQEEGERFEHILNEYIQNGFVEIIDLRGLERAQIKEYQDCYKKNYKKYDWLIYVDMDEYIFLRNYYNIKNFLKRRTFNKCQRIQLNWIFHTDNDLLHYDNRSLFERFPEREIKARGKKKGGDQGIKSILRGKIDVQIYDVHIISKNLTSCDGFGNIKEVQNIITNESDFYFNYIDHFYCKSTEEFINKLKKGSVSHGNNNTEHMLKRINMYFSYNTVTEDKINYIERETKLDLSNYRNRIIKY